MEFTLHLHSKLEDYEQRRSSHVSDQKPSISILVYPLPFKEEKGRIDKVLEMWINYC